MKRNKKSQRILMVIIIALFWFSSYAYGPILTPYCLTHGATLGTAGVILSSYGLMQLLLRAPIGIMSDLAGKRRIFIFLGLGACTLSGAVFLLAEGPVMLFIARSLTGAAMASWSVFVSLYCGLSEQGDYPKMMGTVNLLMTGGQLAGVFCGGIIAQSLGERATFAATITVSAIAIVLFLFVEENYERGGAEVGFKQFLTVAKDKTLWYYSLLALMVSVVNHSSINGFIPALLRESGADSFQLGIGNTLGVIPGVLMAPLACTVIPKKLGFLPAIVCGFVLMTAPVVLLPMTNSIPLMLALEFMCGAGRGMLFPLFTEQATIHFSPAMRTSAMGAFQAIYSMGMFAGPAITGMLSEMFSLKVGFLFLGGAGLATILFIAFFGRRERYVTAR